jgi:hypothetical protein
MKRENPTYIFIRHPLIWVLTVCIGLLMGYYILKSIPPIHWHAPDFEEITINSRIMSIEHYSRSYPRVVLRDKRSILLRVSGVEGKKYISVGDSVVKRAGTSTLTVYRRYPTYTEISVFGEGGELEYPYSGIVQRRRISVAPANAQK